MSSAYGFVDQATEIEVGEHRGSFRVKVDDADELFLDARNKASEIWLSLLNEIPKEDRFVYVIYADIKRTIEEMFFARVDTVRDIQDSGATLKIWFLDRPSAATIDREQTEFISTLQNSLKNEEPVLIVIDPSKKKVLAAAEKKSKFEKADEQVLMAMGADRDASLGSHVTKSELERLFALLAQQIDIPFDYPQDCCYSRAHAMCKILEDEKILSEKVWNYGYLCVPTKHDPDGKVEWWYHVAPVITVEYAGKTAQYVIDPSMFDRPVTVDQWRQAQNDESSLLQRTTRHVYTRGKGGLVSKIDPNLHETKRMLKQHISDRDNLKKKSGGPWKPVECKDL